jgi:hypothetical protein
MPSKFSPSCDYNEGKQYHCNYGNEICQPINNSFEKNLSTLGLWWNNQYISLVLKDGWNCISMTYDFVG